MFDVSAELYTKEGKGFTEVKADSFLLLTNVLDGLIYALLRRVRFVAVLWSIEDLPMNVVALNMGLQSRRVVESKAAHWTLVVTSAWTASCVVAQVEEIVPANAATTKHASCDSRRPP